MEKKGLLEKAGNPELISGIYNYCNRWCERCQFTACCLQFQKQKEEASNSDSQSPDEDNARFWERISETLQTKKVIELTFPDAHLFVRPGFDEYAT